MANLLALNGQIIGGGSSSGGGGITDYLNAGFHNSIYRGEDLGTSVTSDQWSVISSGTFENLFIGDYWTIDNVVYRIAHFDYYLNTGDVECTSHHIIVVPDTALYTAKMNSSDTARYGYYGSAMRGGANYPSGGNLADAVTTANSAFGSEHLISHRGLLTNSINGDVTNDWAWYDSCVELMSEIQVYGCIAWTSSPKYEVGIDREQLALFRLDCTKITNRSGWWLRSVASSGRFCLCYDNGRAFTNGASSTNGVRPLIVIG